MRRPDGPQTHDGAVARIAETAQPLAGAGGRMLLIGHGVTITGVVSGLAGSGTNAPLCGDAAPTETPDGSAIPAIYRTSTCEPDSGAARIEVSPQRNERRETEPGRLPDQSSLSASVRALSLACSRALGFADSLNGTFATVAKVGSPGSSEYSSGR